MLLTNWIHALCGRLAIRRLRSRRRAAVPGSSEPYNGLRSGAPLARHLPRFGSARRARQRRAHEADRLAAGAEVLETKTLLTTFTVNSLLDTADANPGDGVAADDSGNTTLRAAIQEANALVNSGGPDRIEFALTAALGHAGPFVIQVGSELPAITEAVVIDGYSETGAQANSAAAGQPFDTVLQIVLDGSMASDPPIGGNSGLIVQTDNAVVQGLNIQGFSANGIEIDGNNNTVSGNFIGTNVTGTAAAGNDGAGVTVAPGRTGNAITGNVISANAGSGIVLDGNANTVQGNLIGTDKTGAADLGNTGAAGIGISGNDNQIGGTSNAQRNVISGNDNSGIFVLSGANNIIEGNLIGTTMDGTAALGNASGIDIGGATGTRIGGTAAGAGNRIAFNAVDGISVESTAGNNNSILGNSIFENGGLGIDLNADGVTANDAGDGDSGPNRLQNFPAISRAEIDANGDLIVDYLVDSTTSNSAYDLTVQFFEADSQSSGEGKTLLSSDTYTGSEAQQTKTVSLGNAAALGIAAGDSIVATATDSDGNTSEFSAVAQVTAAPPAPHCDPATTLVYDGTAVADDLIVRLADDDSDGVFETLEIVDATGNVRVAAALLADTSALRIFTHEGSDRVTIDETNGLIALPCDIEYDGGSGTDSLVLTGTAAVDADYRVGPSEERGSITHLKDGQRQRIDFTDLEPVIDLVPGAVTVSGTPAANQISVVAHVVSESEEHGLVAIDNFEAYEFNNKTNLTIDAGPGTDVISVSTFTAGHSGNLTVFGGDPADTDALIVEGSDGDDVFGYQPHPQLPGAGTLAGLGGTLHYFGIEDVTVNAGPGNDSFAGLGTTGTTTRSFRLATPPAGGGQAYAAAFVTDNSAGSDPEIVVSGDDGARPLDISAVDFGAAGAEVIAGADIEDGLNSLVFTVGSGDGQPIAGFTFVGAVVGAEEVMPEDEANNNSLDSAGTVAVNINNSDRVVQSGQVAPLSGDVDVIAVNINNSDRVVAFLNNDPDGDGVPTATVLRVLDAQGEELARALDDPAAPGRALLTEPLPAGMYFVEISNNAADDAGGADYNAVIFAVTDAQAADAGPENNTPQTGLAVPANIGRGSVSSAVINDRVELTPLGNREATLRFNNSTPLELIDLEAITVDPRDGTDELVVFGGDHSDTLTFAASTIDVNGQVFGHVNTENFSAKTGSGDDRVQYSDDIAGVFFTTDGGDGDDTLIVGSSTDAFIELPNVIADGRGFVSQDVDSVLVSTSGNIELRGTPAADVPSVSVTPGNGLVSVDAGGVDWTLVAGGTTTFSSTVPVAAPANPLQRIDVHGTDADDAITVSDTQVTVGSLTPINLSGLTAVDVHAARGDDTISVTPSATTEFFVDGGNPIGGSESSGHGDRLIVLSPSGTTVEQLSGPENDAGSVVVAGHATVSYDHIELGRPLVLTPLGGSTVRPQPVNQAEVMAEFPSGTTLPFGLLSFEATVAQPGDVATVQIDLPVDAVLDGELPINAYLKFGPEADDPETDFDETVPHWYSFAYDGTTGAELVDRDGDGMIETIFLHLQDGGRGDADGLANGVIVDPGAPVGRSVATGEVGDNDFRISRLQQILGPNNTKIHAIDVAYRPGRQEYLVAFPNYFSASDVDLLFQRLDAAGQPIGGPVRLSVPNATEFAPQVVYNDVQNEYLVVYHGEEPTTKEEEVFAVRVDADTGMLLTSPIRLTHNGPDGDTSFKTSAASVAFSPSRNQYIVAWYANQAAASQVDVFARVLDGTTAQPVGNQIQLNTSPVSNSSAAQTVPTPSITWDSRQDRWVAAWVQDNGSGTVQTFVRPISASTGTATGAPLPISASAFPPITRSGSASGTKIAFNSRNNQYYVVWLSKTTSGAQALVGQQLDAQTLQPIGNNRALTPPQMAVVPFYPGIGDFDVAYSARMNEYLVSFVADDRRATSLTLAHEVEVYVQRVDAATGDRVGAAAPRISDAFGSVGQRSDSDISGPAVVRADDADVYLAVWADRNEFGNAIFITEARGQFLRYSSTAALTYESTDGDDDLTLRLNPATQTIELVETAGGALLASKALAGTSEIVIDTGAGDDVLRVDLSTVNGDVPLIRPFGNAITFTGGAGRDELRIIGDSPDVDAFYFTGQQEGTGQVVHTTFGSRPQKIDLVDVETVVDDLPGNLSVEAGSNASAITVAGTIHIDNFPAYRIGTHKQDVTVSSGAGVDQVDVLMLPSATVGGTLTVRGRQPQSADHLFVTGSSSSDTFTYLPVAGDPTAGIITATGFAPLKFFGFSDVTLDGGLGVDRLTGQSAVNAPANSYRVPNSSSGNGATLFAGAFAGEPTGEDSTTDTSISVFGHDGQTVLADGDDDSGPGGAAIVTGLSISAEEPSVVIAVTSGDGKAVENYLLVAAAVGPEEFQPDFEPDDVGGALAPIELGDQFGRRYVQSGMLPDADVDVIAVNINNSDRIAVLANNDPDGNGVVTPTSIRLLGADGEQVIDSGANQPGAPANGLLSQPLDGGTYFVEITRQLADGDENYDVLITSTRDDDAVPATSGLAVPVGGGRAGRGGFSGAQSNDRVELTPRGNREATLRFNNSTPLELIDLEAITVDPRDGTDELVVFGGDHSDTLTFAASTLDVNGRVFGHVNTENFSAKTGSGDDRVQYSDDIAGVFFTTDGGDGEDTLIVGSTTDTFIELPNVIADGRGFVSQDVDSVAVVTSGNIELRGTPAADVPSVSVTPGNGLVSVDAGGVDWTLVAGGTTTFSSTVPVAAPANPLQRIDVHATDADDTIAVSDTQVTVGSLTPINLSGLTAVDIHAARGDDTISVTPSATTEFFVDGGNPIGIVGDTLRVIAPGGGPTFFAGPQNDEGAYGTGGQPISFDHIERHFVDDTVPVVSGSIHAFKFHDLDGDGVYDANEPPLAGVTFELTPALGSAPSLAPIGVTRTAVSDQAGQVTFNNVDPGTYLLTEVLPNGMTSTTHATLSTFGTLTGAPGIVLQVGSGQELVWRSGAANLPPGDPRTEVVVRSTALVQPLAPAGASLSRFGAQFGSSVVVDGSFAVVGTPGDDLDLDGDGTKESDVGTVAVYVQNGGSWAMTQTLDAGSGPGGAEAEASFGASVAISGNVAVVGAFGADGDGDGGRDSDGDGIANNDPSDLSAGAAFIFERDPVGGQWTQAQKLQLSDGIAAAGFDGDLFGAAVAVDGDFAVVGAPGHDRDSNGDGDADDPGDFANSGAAYVYKRDAASGTWSLVATLEPTAKGVNRRFGGEVALSGDVAVVREDSGFGVWVFRRQTDANWGTPQLIAPPSTGPSTVAQWSSVDVSGNRLLLGTKDFPVDIDGDGQVESSVGRVFVYEFDSASAQWKSAGSPLQAPAPAAQMNFGTSVSLDGDLAAIGAADRVFVFERTSSGAWNPVREVPDPGLGTTSSEFAVPSDSVALDGGSLLVGARSHDHTPNDTFLGFGEAYAFTVTGDAGLVFGNAANATIGDIVWDDRDRDGVQDAGEPGLDGVTVRLIDAATGSVAATTTTAGGGKYSFNVAPGTYAVEFVRLTDYAFTRADVGSDDAVDSDAAEATGRTATFTVTSGQVLDSVDAGLVRLPPPLNPPSSGRVVGGQTEGVLNVVSQIDLPGLVDLGLPLHADGAAGFGVVFEATNRQTGELFRVVGAQVGDSNLFEGQFDNLPEGDYDVINRLVFFDAEGEMTGDAGPPSNAMFVQIVVPGPRTVLLSQFEDGSPDEYTLRRRGATVELVKTGSGSVAAFTTEEMTSLTIDGSGDDDRLIIDFAGGNPVPVDGVTFNGGGQSVGGGDALVLRGGSAQEVEHRFVNAGSGSVLVGLAGQLSSITYTGLEPIDDQLSATDRRFTFTASSETITLSDDATPDDGRMQISSSSGETVTFDAPTRRLLIHGGAGDDTIRAIGVDALFSDELRLRGQDGNDRIEATGLLIPVTIDGGSGNDVLFGSERDDVLNGGAGNDSVLAGAGDDTVRGGVDDDLLNGEDGDDVVSGGSGVDNLSGGDGDDRLMGGADNDTVDGGNGADHVTGGDGNDSLTGAGDDDRITGGDGDDTLEGGTGDDTLNGAADNDVLAGGDDDDALFGGGGNDTLRGDAGDDRLRGQGGDDSLNGSGGDDRIDGGDGTDTLAETADANLTLTANALEGVGLDRLSNLERVQLTGGPSANRIDASRAAVPVTLDGMAGNDTLVGGPFADSLFGGDGDDLLDGGTGADSLTGGDGDDTLDGDAGNDVLLGKGGDDRLIGDDGNDSITGGGGHDLLSGNSGDDALLGCDGNDSLFGGTGRDTVIGGAGADRVRGQGGTDVQAGGTGNDDRDAGDQLEGPAGEIDELFQFAPGTNWLDCI